MAFSQPLPKLRPADVEDFLHPFCAKLVNNNEKTQHFGQLLVHIVESLKTVSSDTKEIPLRAINGVYITRVFVKYFTEHATSTQINSLLKGPTDSPKVR